MIGCCSPHPTEVLTHCNCVPAKSNTKSFTPLKYRFHENFINPRFLPSIIYLGLFVPLTSALKRFNAASFCCGVLEFLLLNEAKATVVLSVGAASNSTF